MEKKALKSNLIDGVRECSVNQGFNWESAQSSGNAPRSRHVRGTLIVCEGWKSR